MSLLFTSRTAGMSTGYETDDNINLVEYIEILYFPMSPPKFPCTPSIKKRKSRSLM